MWNIHWITSPTSSLELFFVIKVVSKQIAEVNMVGTHDHAIIAGEAYIVDNYLENKETKKHVEFKITKNYQFAYIHLTEILAANIEINYGYKQMSILMSGIVLSI